MEILSNGPFGTELDVAQHQADRVSVLLRRHDYGRSQRGVKKQARVLEDYIQSQESVGIPVFELLGKTGHYPVVARNLERFQDVDHQYLSDELLATNQQKILLTTLGNFEALSEHTARTLLQADNHQQIAHNLSSFTQELSPEVAIELVTGGQVVDVIRNLDQFPALDHNELIQMLFEANDYNLVINHIESFHGVDHNAIAQQLAAVGGRTAELLLGSIENFQDVDQTALALQYISSDSTATLANSLLSGKLPLVDKNALFNAALIKHKFNDANLLFSTLIETDKLDSTVAIGMIDASVDHISTVLGHLKHFPTLDHNVLVEVVFKKSPISIIWYVGMLEGVDCDEIAERLLNEKEDIEAIIKMLSWSLGSMNLKNEEKFALRLIELGGIEYISSGMSKLERSNKQTLFMAMLDKSAAYAAPSLRHCSNLGSSIMERLLKAGQTSQVIFNLDAFTADAQSGLVTGLLKNGQAKELINYKNKLGKVVIDGALVAECFQQGDIYYQDLCELSESFHLQGAPNYLEVALRIFGKNGDDMSLRMCKNIAEGFLGEDAVKLGVTKTGDAGLAELATIMDTIQSRFVALDKETTELILDNSAIYGSYKSFVRFGENQWGSRADSSLRRMLRRSLDPNLSTELKEGYEPSDVVSVSLMGHGELSEEAHEAIPEDAVLRYKRLRAALSGAVESIEGYVLGNEPFEELLLEIQDGLDEKIKRMVAAHDTLLGENKESQAKYLHGQVEALRHMASVGIRNFGGVEDSFKLLHKEKALADPIMSILLARALRFNQTIDAEARRERFDYARGDIHALPEEPTYESLAKVVDMVGHTVIQETYDKEFTDPATRRALRTMFNVESLEAALKRHDEAATSTAGKAQLQFIPSRGLLMELSGHIGDACWADKYNRISDQFENMTAVVMLRHYRDKPPRMMGSMMLIETHDEHKDEPYIIIRGLNPVQNLINRLDVAEFHKVVEDYVGEIASARGSKVGIVIDRMSGMSGTNRPALHRYLEDQKKNLIRVRVPDDETRFNGYIVSDRVYARPSA